VMKALILIGVVVAAGCAAEPESQLTNPSPPAQTVAIPQDQDLVEAIRMAMENGYKIVDEDGQRLYCREDVRTGSRIRSTLSCLTAEQLKGMRQQFERDLENMRRKGLGSLPGSG